MGGVLYAALQSELIELFGLDGCLLIVGALALNVVACAGPMRPLTPPKYYLKHRAAILARADEEQLQEEFSAKDPTTAMESKEPPVRRRSLFSRSAFVKMKKTKMGHYLQSVNSFLLFTLKNNHMTTI